MKWHNTFDNWNLLLNGVRERARERKREGGIKLEVCPVPDSKTIRAGLPLDYASSGGTGTSSVQLSSAPRQLARFAG